MKLKAPDQPQSLREESILIHDITVNCATHILKSKARAQSIQASKKFK